MATAVCLVGAPGCGKSAFALKLSIGVYLELGGGTLRDSMETQLPDGSSLLLTDVGGLEPVLLAEAMPEQHAFILCFAVDEEDALDNAQLYYNTLADRCADKPVLLLATKADADERAVSAAEATALAAKLHLPFAEVSAKQDERDKLQQVVTRFLAGDLLPPEELPAAARKEDKELAAASEEKRDEAACAADGGDLTDGLSHYSPAWLPDGADEPADGALHVAVIGDDDMLLAAVMERLLRCPAAVIQRCGSGEDELLQAALEQQAFLVCAAPGGEEAVAAVLDRLSDLVDKPAAVVIESGAAAACKALAMHAGAAWRPADMEDYSPLVASLAAACAGASRRM